MVILSSGLLKVLAWFFLILIIILSLIPGATIPKMKWQDLLGLDKIIHFLMYGFCFYLFIKAYKIQWNTALFYSSFAALVILGLILEYLQMELHSGRSFDLYDLLANIIGLLTVCLVLGNGHKHEQL